MLSNLPKHLQDRTILLNSVADIRGDGPVIVWLKSAEIDYLKPADTTLRLHFKISKKDVELAERKLNTNGKFEVWHIVEAVNKKGIICVRARMQIYLRCNKKNKNLGF